MDEEQEIQRVKPEVFFFYTKNPEQCLFNKRVDNYTLIEIEVKKALKEWMHDYAILDEFSYINDVPERLDNNLGYLYAFFAVLKVNPQIASQDREDVKKFQHLENIVIGPKGRKGVYVFLAVPYLLKRENLDPYIILPPSF